MISFSDSQLRAVCEATRRPTRRELAELEGLRVPVPQLERAASTPNTTTRRIAARSGTHCASCAIASLATAMNASSSNFFIMFRR